MFSLSLDVDLFSMERNIVTGQETIRLGFEGGFSLPFDFGGEFQVLRMNAIVDPQTADFHSFTFIPFRASPTGPFDILSPKVFPVGAGVKVGLGGGFSAGFDVSGFAGDAVQIPSARIHNFEHFVHRFP